MATGPRVVVTGIGVVSPAGIGTGPYMTALKGGQSHIGLYGNTGPVPKGIYVAGKVPDLTETSTSRVTQLAMRAVDEVLHNRGERCRKHKRWGICFGSAISGTLEVEEQFRLKRDQNPVDVRFGEITDKIATRVSATGPQYTLATGCVSGIDALGIGVDQIMLGNADAMLVVAADATLSPIVFAAFDQIGALSHKCSPIDASQPFGIARDGFVLAEGAAAVLLERWGSDLEDSGVKPLVEVVAWDSISSAFHMTSMRTDGADLIRLVKSVLTTANCSIDRIDLVDVHGTSTRINDLAEANAMASLFSGTGHIPSFTAQKGNVGHSLGASNLVEFVGLCLMISNEFIAQGPCSQAVDPRLGIKLEGSHHDVPKPVRCALKLSSSFSGIHSAVLINSAAAMFSKRISPTLSQELA